MIVNLSLISRYLQHFNNMTTENSYLAKIPGTQLYLSAAKLPTVIIMRKKIILNG